MSVNGVDNEISFDSIAGYRGALDELFVRARRDLAIFDTDLQLMQFDLRSRVEPLSRFFLARPGARLRVVVHDTSHVERRCAPLMTLLTSFSHCFEVRRTPAELRHLTECFALADGASAVVRFHTDHARGKKFFDLPEEGQGWLLMFEEMWELSEPGVAPTCLGL